VEKNTITSFFYGFFEQSQHVQGPIYIINGHKRRRPSPCYPGFLIKQAVLINLTDIVLSIQRIKCAI